MGAPQLGGGDGSKSGPPPAGRPRSARGRLTHPLTLALVPAVASVLVGVFAWFPIPVPEPQPNNTESTSVNPPAAHEAGIAFRLDPDLEEYRRGWDVVFDGPLPSTDDYPSGDPGYVEVYSWAKTRGAVDVGISHLRLLLENTGPDRVTIRSISAEVKSRQKPIDTTDVVSPSAGTNELVALAFDLDSGDLVSAQPENAEGSQADTSNLPFFSTKNVTLDPGETTEIKITTRTKECHCLYNFEVVVVKPDSTTTLEIGDMNGRPLAITARAPRYQNSYENGALGCGSSGLFYRKTTGVGDLADCDRPA